MSIRELASSFLSQLLNVIINAAGILVWTYLELSIYLPRREYVLSFAIGFAIGCAIFVSVMLVIASAM